MDLAVVVVPVEGDAHVLVTILVDFNVVSFTQSYGEVGCVFFTDVLDPKIINNKGKIDGALLACPNARCHIALFIAMFTWLIFEQLPCQWSCLW